MTYTDTVNGVLVASNHSIISSVFKDEIKFVTTTFFFFFFISAQNVTIFLVLAMIFHENSVRESCFLPV